jgi:hypothetical protein
LCDKVLAVCQLPQASTIAERGQLLNDYFTYSLYVNICRSLFERHKLQFSFILAVKTLQHTGSVDPKEWRFLLAGPVSTGSEKRSSAGGARDAALDNPAPDWLTEKAWAELLGLAQLPAYSGLEQHLAQHLEHYKAIFDSNEVRVACRQRRKQSVPIWVSPVALFVCDDVGTGFVARLMWLMKPVWWSETPLRSNSGVKVCADNCAAMCRRHMRCPWQSPLRAA